MARRRIALPVPFQLAAAWTPSLPRTLSGWVCSEKLDGVRAMWDGRGNLISRNGICFKAPAEFTAGLPRGVVLDGELWMDRGMFSDTVSIIRTRSTWSSLIKFKVLDVYSPTIRLYGYADRIDWLHQASVLRDTGGHISVHETSPFPSCYIATLMTSIVSQGGEGLVVRDPLALYSPGRKSALLSPMLKVKPFLDDEATVVGMAVSQGRHGSLTVRDRQGREFRIASGLRDVKFENPPKIGETITFGYTSRHEGSGLPRFPRYIRSRIDADFTHT